MHRFHDRPHRPGGKQILDLGGSAAPGPRRAHDRQLAARAVIYRWGGGGPWEALRGGLPQQPLKVCQEPFPPRLGSYLPALTMAASTQARMVGMPPMLFMKKVPDSHGFVNPRQIQELWRDQFDWVYRELDDAVFAFTIHRDVSGRPQVLLMLSGSSSTSMATRESNGRRSNISPTTSASVTRSPGDKRPEVI